MPPKDIASLLTDLGLEEYVDVFQEADLDMGILSEVTEQDLKELGVTVLGHRKRILKAARTLAIEEDSRDDEEAPTTDPPTPSSTPRSASVETQTPAPPSTPLDHLLDQLEALSHQRQRGELSPEAFEDRKRSLLAPLITLDPEPSDEESSEADRLLTRLEELHPQVKAGALSQAAFDEEKKELLSGVLPARPEAPPPIPSVPMASFNRIEESSGSRNWALIGLGGIIALGTCVAKTPVKDVVDMCTRQAGSLSVPACFRG